MARPTKLLTEDNLLKIKNDSFIGMIDINYIQKEYNFSKKTAERAIKKLKLIHTDQYIIDMIKEYLNGSSAQELAKKYNTSDVNINAILRRRGIERRGVQYISNTHYFDNIDTEDKAYYLGFIYADGCLSKNELKISIKSCDIDILEKLKRYMNSSHNIFIKISTNSFNNKQTEIAILGIAHKNIKNALNKHGVISNKTFKIQWPSTIENQNLYKHFIRGYMDGDGSFTKDKNNRYSIQFCGTIEFLESLKLFLEENLDINCNKNLYKRWPERNTNIRQLTISGKNNVKTVLSWLYKDSCVYLDRKYNKYLNLIN